MKKEKIVEETQEKEELQMSDEFVDKKEKKKESLLSKIIWTLIFIVVIIWLGVLLTDFSNTKQQKEPKFCLETEIIEYEDGSVKLCKGLGYKIYHYERESYKAWEFGPFWIKDRSDKQAK